MQTSTTIHSHYIQTTKSGHKNKWLQWRRDLRFLAAVSCVTTQLRKQPWYWHLILASSEDLSKLHSHRFSLPDLKETMGKEVFQQCPSHPLFCGVHRCFSLWWLHCCLPCFLPLCFAASPPLPWSFHSPFCLSGYKKLSPPSFYVLHNEVLAFMLSSSPLLTEPCGTEVELQSRHCLQPEFNLNGLR